MPDRFGPISVPLETPKAGEAAGDPLLTMLLDFLRAFLVADQNVTAAWRLAGVAPNLAPVVGAFPWDPEELPFSTEQLPALFCWRVSGSDDYVGEDYLIDTTELRLLWVMPHARPEEQKPRSPVINAMHKAVAVAVERGRTPAWRRPGDLDPAAAKQGSFLGTYLEAWALYFTRWRVTKVSALGADERIQMTFPALEMTLTLQENQVIGDAGDDRSVDLTGADVSITDPTDGDRTVVEGLFPNTPV